MSYGHKSGDVRMYEYGVPRSALHHGLGEGQDEAIREMRRRVKLWNRLVEIDREIGAKRAEMLAPYPQPENGRRVLPGEIKQALRDLEESYREPVNAACRESGCWWGNYSEVKITWQAARKRPGQVRFHRWAGDGRLAAFIAHGLPVTAAYQDRRILRIREGARPGDALVSMRYQSQDRQPVWLTLPIRMHRPLPADGLIRSVAVSRRWIGTQERWSVLFCIERPNGWRTYEGPRSGRVAIDLGWRRVPEGLRVATWQNDAGETGTLELPESFLWAMQKVEDLQGIRDKLWNETIAALRAWRAEHGTVPEWLAEPFRYMHAWKRKGRLVSLFRKWEDLRFKGDEVAFAIVEKWLERDNHLWDWEANLRDQTLGNRRDRYRVFAAGLVRRYSEIVLEDFDLSEVAEAKVRAGDALPWGGEATVADRRIFEAAQHHRQWAGVYQLRLCIESAAKREGVTVLRQAAAYSTIVCSKCGSLERWDKARELRHLCSECGREWDQDENATENLLAGELSYAR